MAEDGDVVRNEEDNGNGDQPAGGAGAPPAGGGGPPAGGGGPPAGGGGPPAGGGGGPPPPIRGWAAIFTRLIDFYEYLIRQVDESPLQFHFGIILASFSLAAFLAIVLAAIQGAGAAAVMLSVVMILCVLIAVLAAISAIFLLRARWQLGAEKALKEAIEDAVLFAAKHQKNPKVIKAISGSVGYLPKNYISKWDRIIASFSDALAIWKRG